MRVRPLNADERPRIYCTECRRGVPAVQRSDLYVVDLSQHFHFIVCRFCLAQMEGAIVQCRVTHDPCARAFADVQHAATMVAERAEDLLEKTFQFQGGIVPEALPHLTQYQVDAKEVYGPLALAVYEYQRHTRLMLALAKEARNRG